MNEGFTRIKSPSESETVIEKSRFLARSGKCATEEEARAFIAEVRKAHPFATHNCYAFVAEGGAVKRFSDDGEPQGTAGQPILEAINLKGLSDTCVVVTRYFGGIKLGAGGLVRAYSSSAAEVLDLSGREKVVASYVYEIKFSYELYSAFCVFAAKVGCKTLAVDFGEAVTVQVAAPKADGDFGAKIADFSAGKAKVETKGETFAVYGE